MLVRIWWRKPCRAQVAEMRTTLEANHVIATMSLLARSSAGRARSRVSLQVFQGFLVLFGKFSSVGFWCTCFEFTVPALVTSAAKCERAVFTHSKQISSSHECSRAAWFCIWFIVCALCILETLRLAMFFRPSCSLAPLSWAVDGILVRLQLSLVLQLYVSRDCIMFKRDLQQFAGTELRLRSSILLRGCRCFGPFFRAIWCQAPDWRQIPLLDRIVIEVLQALNAENMAAIEHSVANWALLGI